MSSTWADWLEQLPPFSGLLAAGLRLPDQTTRTRVWAEGYAEAALANAWRCVDDTFRVMRLHRFPTRQLRWTYSAAILTAVRRDDGYLLLILTRDGMDHPAKNVVSSWITDFLSTGLDTPP